MSTIPLQLTFAAASVTTPGNQVVTITGSIPTSKIMAVTVRYGGYSGPLLFTGTSTSDGLITIPTSENWFDSAGITTSGEITVYVEASKTVSGNTYQGRGTFKVVAGEDAYPVFGTPAITPINTGPALTNYPSTFIAGVSRMKVAVEITRPTNAQLTSVEFGTSSGALISMSYNSGTGKWEAETDYTLTASTWVRIFATDQRGVSVSTAKTNVTVEPYVRPYVTIYPDMTYRCNSGGTEMDTGQYYRVKVMANISALTGNAVTVLTVQRSDLANANAITSGVQSAVLDTSDPMNQGLPYTLIFTIQDKVMSRQFTFDLEAPSRELVVHHSADGTNVGVGGVPTVTSGCSTVELPAGGKFMVGGVSLVDIIYPVDSVYMSAVNTDPATLFGGNWSSQSQIGSFYVWKRTA